MTTIIDTLIIGGGQAGLATSYYLGKLGGEHLVLEQAAQAGNAWRNDRWDSFALLTPNWSFQLPGAPYQGAAPESFMPRDEIVERFEQYVQRFQLPVQYGVRVSSVTPMDGGYCVQSEAEEFRARQVVVATGLHQRPKLPAFASQLSRRVAQVHSGQYRNPSALPDGAVLVVGSGQSGAQIAEELYFSGRKVYLCVSSAGRAPRRYRGKDIYEWLHLSGFLDRAVEKLPSPKARFNANPHLSSRDGGRTLNLHQFARDGVSLLGRLRGGQGERLLFHSDLHENLAKADRFEAELARLVDDLQDISQIDTGRFRITRAPFDLVQLAQEIVTAQQATTQAHRLILRTPSHPIEVNWDRDRIAQVLINLLSNAIKYSGGGTITLEVQPHGGEVRIAVSDQGKGIPPEDLPRLFHPFTRLNTPAGVKGTGVGLFITKGIIQAHNGHIDVVSTVGQGTTFRITIPTQPS
jgi:putative flavoprotein involved in K+ transport